MGRVYGSNAVIMATANRVRRYQRMKRYANLVRYRSPALVAASAGLGALSNTSYGKYAMRNAGRFARKAYSYIKRQRDQVGERIGKDRTRSTNSAENFNSIDSRTLYSVPLITNITEGTGNSQRMRDLINLRGFKIRMEINNDLSGPIVFSIALVHPKATYDLTTLDWFRDNGGDRATNFNDNLTSLDFATRQINTDRYAVFMHKKYRLSADGDTSLPNTDRTRILDFYVPIKKQIRFDEVDVGELPVHQCYLVYWCDRLNAGSLTPPQQDAMTVNYRFITYFRNTKD